MVITQLLIHVTYISSEVADRLTPVGSFRPSDPQRRVITRPHKPQHHIAYSLLFRHPSAVTHALSRWPYALVA